MSENSDNRVTEFNCLGCGALVVVEHELPMGLTRPLRVTCDYCGNEYLSPEPGEIIYSRKLGAHTYVSVASGDVYVSPDDGETWSIRHASPPTETEQLRASVEPRGNINIRRDKGVP